MKKHALILETKNGHAIVQAHNMFELTLIIPEKFPLFISHCNIYGSVRLRRRSVLSSWEVNQDFLPSLFFFPRTQIDRTGATALTENYLLPPLKEHVCDPEIKDPFEGLLQDVHATYLYMQISLKQIELEKARKVEADIKQGICNLEYEQETILAEIHKRKEKQ